MDKAWRTAATEPLRTTGVFAAVLTLALGCVAGNPAWSACPPGSNQGNCQAPEPQRQPQVQQPRPQQFEPQRQPQVQQPGPQVQQQRPQQFEPQRQPPVQPAPAQLHRPAPATGAAPVSTGAAVVRPGPAVTGPVRVGGPPARDARAPGFAYHGQTSAPFRAGRYQWPNGMSYRRYGVGAYLPLAFIVSAYVIADWAGYGLAPPMPGYEWVRYGPDLVQVDPGNGQIVDAAYGAFAESDEAASPGYGQIAPPYLPPPVDAQPPPQAAGPQRLGSYGNWVAAAYQENGLPVCYASTQAIASTPPVANRGVPVLTISQRPDMRDAVSIGGILAGAGDAGVVMRVGLASFDFYPAGSNVFARDGTMAIAAFRSGSQATVQSPLPDGGVVSDMFSLIGFSAAYAAISGGCPVR